MIGLNLDSKHLSGRYQILNGLRGITLIWVIFVHLPSDAVPSFLLHIHDTWRFGVDFFLAISGFLVTRSLSQCFVRFKGPTRKRDASIEFLIRRVARIFPSYFVVLFSVGALAFAFRGGLLEQLRALGPTLLSFPLFFGNYTIPIFLHKLPHALIILWSVSFQEQFYLLLLVFYLFQKIQIKTLLLLSASASIITRTLLTLGPWAGENHSEYLEMWLHLNFDAIAWGCLAWIYYEPLSHLWKGRLRSSLFVLFLLCGNAAVISAPSFFPSDFAQAITSSFKAPLFALSVRAACEIEDHAHLLARLLRSRFLGWVGTISYETYLFHVLLFGVLQKLGLQGLTFTAIAYPLALIVGHLAYQKIGMPGQDFLKSRLRRALLPIGR